MSPCERTTSGDRITLGTGFLLALVLLNSLHKAGESEWMTNDPGLTIARLELTTMQIFVVNDTAVTEQTRAYTEYRVFTALAALSRLVEDVEVRLESATGDGSDTRCVVCVQTTSGKRARVRARGHHPYDAINRAADRIGRRLWEIASAEHSIRQAP
jgi:ribosome-associated translation inhibitor RaiA